MDIPFADELLERHVARRSRARPIEPLATLDLGRVRRVLLVLTTGLGDAVLSTPVFPALRARLPGADIRLFVRSVWAELFRADPDLTGLLRYHGKYRRFLATLAELRAFAPELTLVLHGNDPDILPLAYLAGSRHIVRIPVAGTRFRALLSNRARAEDEHTVPGLHYVDNRLRVLDTLGVEYAAATPRIALPQALRERVARELGALTGGRPWFVYHAFAADAYKVWPHSREFLLRAAAEYPGLRIVLTGSARDRRPLIELAAAAGGAEAIVLAGKLDVAETAAVLAGSACVIAPDTGILHLAAALGAPVVGLYAPTFASLVGPRGAPGRTFVLQKPQTCDPCVEKKCPYVPENCMRQIAVSETLSALAAALRAADGDSRIPGGRRAPAPLN